MLEPISKSQIRNIMRAEQKSTGITRINPGLYRSLIEYLGRLNQAYLQAHRDNETQKALTLTKDIRDTERDISTIYELRERKVLLMAQDTVRGGAPSLKHLFPEEKLLLLRLSSILLAQRKDIGIDFDPKVERYLKTVAREYDLERMFLTPFHPLDPLCRDDPVTAVSTGEEGVAEAMERIPAGPGDTGNGAGQRVTLSAGNGGAGESGTRPEPEPGPGTVKGSPPAMDDPGMRGIEIRKDIAGDEMIERIGEPAWNTPDPRETTGDPGQFPAKSPEAGRSSPTPGDGGSGAPGRGGSDGPGVQETATDAGEVGGPEKGLGDGITDPDEIGEEEGTDFLREYVITGTLDATPQFRGNDLHDYRFEPGEIISLPVKMGELLEKQGKVFIVNIGQRLKTPRGKGS